MTDRSNWNQSMIEKFRASGGTTTMPSGQSLLLLHHRGAKTGIERVNPVVYREAGGGYAIFASKSGYPSNPDWYYNLLAHPDVTIEIGNKTVPVHARVLQGEEREPIWNAQKEQYPHFAEYEKTSQGREIPVIILEPR